MYVSASTQAILLAIAVLIGIVFGSNIAIMETQRKGVELACDALLIQIVNCE